MPRGHTDRATIADRPISPGMLATLRRIAKGPASTRWSVLSRAEQNHVRALHARGLVYREHDSVDMTRRGVEELDRIGGAS